MFICVTFSFLLYLLFELMLLLYLALENPIFPYLSPLLPEFGANRIEKSVLDCLNGFMLTHIYLVRPLLIYLTCD
jgi:hypothetical protein